MVFPRNSLRGGNGREAVKQRRPSRSAPGVSRGTINRMGCGACWDETYREKGDVVRGGWADVARRLPASSSVWVAAIPFSGKRHSAEWVVSEFAGSPQRRFLALTLLNQAGSIPSLVRIRLEEHENHHSQ